MQRIKVTVSCDRHGCANQSVAIGPNAVAARRMATRDGWHSSAGKDICPVDWNSGWRHGRYGWTHPRTDPA